MRQDGPANADVVIVGAGAAGLTAAILTARGAPGARVVLVDGAERIGAKLLMAGGGRCNVTNARVEPADFCGGSRNVIRRVLAAWPVAATVGFFDELGVQLREEDGGKLFAVRGGSRAVVDALLGEVGRLGVELRTGWRVDRIDRVADGLAVRTSAGCVTGRAVLLATGGRSYPKTGSDGSGYALARSLGHSVVPTTPALVPLLLEGAFHRDLSGISQDVTLTVHAAGGKPVRLTGSMLWTHLGVSGPVVLDASRHWHGATLDGGTVGVTVNFLPDDDFAEVERRVMAATAASPNKTLMTVVSRWLPARVATAMLSKVGVSGMTKLGQVSREQRRRLVHALTAWPLPVTGSRGYVVAEITAGGVPLGEVDPTTMASRCCEGLYLAGEVLDVDGRVGGFNLQWAWSSAAVAAAAMADRLSI